jgi:hypothetical protein
MESKAFCLCILAQSNTHITREKDHNRQKQITPICPLPAARVRAIFLRGSHGDISEGVATYYSAEQCA